jgi:glycosyltransferase involved in cell wall biosynthesis
MSITLCMIVKNEAHNIVQTLESALPYVDDVVIVDTGSTDDTKVLIDGCLRAKHTGVLLSRPWVDYSHNRNECLDLALDRIRERHGEHAWEKGETCKTEMSRHWLLMLSGDSVLVLGNGALEYQYRSSLDNLVGSLAIQDSKHTAFAIETRLGKLRYPTVRLFRADSDWRYVGKVHEIPKSASGQTYGFLPSSSVHVQFFGSDFRDKPAQWRKHLPLLESQMKEEQGANPRTVFYLAQTHACLMQYHEAAQYYQLRLKMKGGWEPERWETRLRLGLLDTIFTAKEREDFLVRCTIEKPNRAEPWFYLAEMYALQAEMGRSGLRLAGGEAGTQEDWWNVAYANARLAVECVNKGQQSSDLFIRTDIYAYRAHMLLAVCAYQTGRNVEAKSWFEELISHKDDQEHVAPNPGDVILMRQHLADIQLQEERAK